MGRVTAYFPPSRMATTHMELMQRAGVAAVLAAIEMGWGVFSPDEGADVTVSRTLTSPTTSMKVSVDLQLKSTRGVLDRSTNDDGLEVVKFVVDRALYARLRSDWKQEPSPLVLVVMEMPAAPIDRCIVARDATSIVGNMWWAHGHGWPVIPSAQESITIAIPTTQVFTPDAMARILKSRRRDDSGHRIVPSKAVPVRDPKVPLP